MAINRTLIQGQRLMREAGKDTRGESLVKGFSTVLAAGIAERKAIKATTDKYMEDLGGIENMNLIEPSQRAAVTDFLRTKRDEFNGYALQYAENPTSEIKDKMDAIKFQFQTANNQLKTYMDKRKEYLTDRDEGNLLTGDENEKKNTFFESTYGDPDAKFAIDYETGKISFTGNNGTESETRSLDDFGDHSLRNFEGETVFATFLTAAKKAKYDGTFFDKNTLSQQFVFKHRGQGADEIQSLIQTDLSGDDSDLGFMQQWASGGLKDKSLYDGFEANKDGTYDASWMLENGNKQKVLDAMGKFVGNVSEEIYNNSAENPETVRKRNAEFQKLNQGSNPPGTKKMFSDSQYLPVDNSKSIPGGVANRIVDQIRKGGTVQDPQEGITTTYSWKFGERPGWYDDSTGELVAEKSDNRSANDDLVLYLGLSSDDFFDIPDPVKDEVLTRQQGLNYRATPTTSYEMFMGNPVFQTESNLQNIEDTLTKEYDMPIDKFRIKKDREQVKNGLDKFIDNIESLQEDVSPGSPSVLWTAGGGLGYTLKVSSILMKPDFIDYIDITDKTNNTTKRFYTGFKDTEQGQKLAELEAQRLNEYLKDKEVLKKK